MAMTKIGTAIYLRHYATSYFHLNRYAPYQRKDGVWIWRYAEHLSSGWTSTQLGRRGIRIHSWHNEPLTADEILQMNRNENQKAA